MFERFEEHFKKLFMMNRNRNLGRAFDNVLKVVIEEMNVVLTKWITEDEVTRAVF